jgi:hypothetical protein
VPQFRFEASVPSIQAQSRLRKDAKLDCDIPNQAGEFVECKFVTVKLCSPVDEDLSDERSVSICEPVGQAATASLHVARPDTNCKQESLVSEPSVVYSIQPGGHSELVDGDGEGLNDLVEEADCASVESIETKNNQKHQQQQSFRERC